MRLKRYWRAAAIFFTVIGAVASLLLFRLRWTPREDFDILGIGWIIMNTPQLGVIVIAIVSLGAAAYFWIRYLLA